MLLDSGASGSASRGKNLILRVRVEGRRRRVVVVVGVVVVEEGFMRVLVAVV